VPAKVAVIGSGISGISAAHKLIENNCAVTIFDQGKNPGGRLGLRSLRNSPFINRPVDVGAAYFTISDSIFQNKVDNWQQLDLVHKWTDTFHVFNDYEISTTTGPMRYSTKKGLRSLAIHELAELTKIGVNVLQERKIERVVINPSNVKVDNEEFDAVVLAMPGIQAARIIENDEIANELNKQNWASALSAWFVIDSDTPKYDAMFVNNHEVISLIVNDGKRRGDNAPVINVITTSNYAKSRLENFANYADEVIDHALEIWNIQSEVVEKGITRWSIAQPSPATRPELPGRLAIVGDAYSDNPRIESAWLDGVAVLNQLEILN
jgi:renalase